MTFLSFLWLSCTYMNQHSSRSHAIFILTIECCSVSGYTLVLALDCPFLYIFNHFQRGIDGADHIRVGKLNMVDLAGSERQEKTGTTVNSTLYCIMIISLLKRIFDTRGSVSRKLQR